MTDIIFSFDTEDFTSSHAADAILREAEILREEGVVGCFCLVGHLADQLVAWKRNDVLEALSHHEIHTHSLGHSLHPTINEYTDIADAKDAIARVIREEELALQKIREATGTERVYAAVPPGNSKSYAAMYAYAKMGIPIYADTVCDTERADGVYYCNMLQTKYTVSLESSLMGDAERGINEIISRALGKRRAIIYTHPNIALYSDFWDLVNYKGENKHPFGEWEEAPRLPEEKTEAFYSAFRELVRRIKRDPRFRITTYRELADEISREGVRVIHRRDTSAIRAALSERFYPITGKQSLSLADILLACRDFLLGSDEHKCGFVYGFLDTPYSISEPTRLTAAEVISGAKEIRDGEFLPTRINCKDKTVGPADFLFAALDVILGKDEVTILPRPQLPSLDELTELRDMALRDTWIHSPDFKDEYLSERLRLQSYTMRPYISK